MKREKFDKVLLVDWKSDTCFIPDKLEDGVFYYSDRYHTASHLCPCGCGNVSVTPIQKTKFGINHEIKKGWELLTKKIEGTTEKDRPFDFTVTLTPSLLNKNCPNKSHYYIQESNIIYI